MKPGDLFHHRDPRQPGGRLVYLGEDACGLHCLLHINLDPYYIELTTLNELCQLDDLLQFWTKVCDG